jgi:hypothetical protein
MKITEIKKSAINPRKMTKEAQAGLKKSLEMFGDISGIIFNKRTNELIGGNHRWEELLKIYDKKKLELKELKENSGIYAIYHDDEFTSYTVRVVDWDEDTAKAANITANNQHISGYFTKEIDDVLAQLKDHDYFNDLKLGNLYIDLPIPDVHSHHNLKEDDLFEDHEEDFVLDDVNDEYAEEVDLNDNKKCKKAEVTIMIEGDISVLDLQNLLKSTLTNCNYKVSFLSIEPN